MKQILLINDMAGYGKVATAAMLPILSYMGISVYNLPTALVSNTLDYGKYNIMETTDYMAGVFPVWKELGFHFDAIATGFIVSERQARLVADYCKEQAHMGTPILVDPIMGDDGKLYNSVTPDRVAMMREMVAVADLIVPNYTEAAYLTGTEYASKGVSRQQAVVLIDALRGIGAKSVVVTSMKVDRQDVVAGYNHNCGQYFFLPFTMVAAHFPGTGDTFSAVLFGHLLRGDKLELSTQAAMDAVGSMVALNKDNKDKNCGLPIEKHLGLL